MDTGTSSPDSSIDQTSTTSPSAEYGTTSESSGFVDEAGSVKAADDFDDVWNDGTTEHYDFCDRYSLSENQCVYEEVSAGAENDSTAGNDSNSSANWEALSNIAEKVAEKGTDLAESFAESAANSADAVGTQLKESVSDVLGKNENEPKGDQGKSSESQKDADSQSQPYEPEIEENEPIEAQSQNLENESESPETASGTDQAGDSEREASEVSTSKGDFLDEAAESLERQLGEAIKDGGEAIDRIADDPIGAYGDYLDAVLIQPGTDWATEVGETTGSVLVGLEELENDIRDNGLEAIERRAEDAVDATITGIKDDVGTVLDAYQDVPSSLADGDFGKAAQQWNEGRESAFGLAERAVGAGQGIKSASGFLGIIKPGGKFSREGFRKAFGRPDSDGRKPNNDSERYAERRYQETKAEGRSNQKAGEDAHEAANARENGPDYNTYGEEKYSGNPHSVPEKAVPYMEEIKFHKKVTRKEARAAERQVEKASIEQQRQTGLVPITKTTLYEMSPNGTKIFDFFRGKWIKKKGK